MVQVGEAAPDFTLKSDEDQDVKLSDLRGQKVVLAFYPLDWSPGCTNQMDAFTKDFSRFEEQGAKVFGISVDSVWSHKAWRQSRGMPFPLLADFNPKGGVAEAYGVYNAERGNARRATFVIDEQGIVRDKDESQPGETPSVDLVCDMLAKVG